MACVPGYSVAQHLCATNDVFHCQSHKLRLWQCTAHGLASLLPADAQQADRKRTAHCDDVVSNLPTYLPTYPGYSCGQAYPRRCLARVSDEERHGAEGPTTRGEAPQFRNRDGATWAWRPFACARRLRAHTSGGMGPPQDTAGCRCTSACKALAYGGEAAGQGRHKSAQGRREARADARDRGPAAEAASAARTADPLSCVPRRTHPRGAPHRVGAAACQTPRPAHWPVPLALQPAARRPAVHRMRALRAAHPTAFAPPQAELERHRARKLEEELALREMHVSTLQEELSAALQQLSEAAEPSGAVSTGASGSDASPDARLSAPAKAPAKAPASRAQVSRALLAWGTHENWIPLVTAVRIASCTDCRRSIPSDTRHRRA